MTTAEAKRLIAEDEKKILAWLDKGKSKPKAALPKNVVSDPSIERTSKPGVDKPLENGPKPAKERNGVIEDANATGLQRAINANVAKASKPAARPTKPLSGLQLAMAANIKQQSR
jgi:hypothetical protein